MAETTVTLENGDISFEVPDDFHPMTAAELNTLYFDRTANTQGYCSANGKASITYYLHSTVLQPDQLESVKNAFTSAINRASPAVQWGKNDLIDVNGTRWIILETTATHNGATFHNFALITTYHGLMFSMNFTAADSVFASYHDALWASIQSLRLADNTALTPGSAPSLSPDEEVARAQIALRSSDLETAETHYTLALKNQPHMPEALFGLAAVAADRGEYEQAVQRFTDALPAQPDPVHAYIGRALAEQHLGDFTDALKDANQAIMLKPGYCPAFAARARIELAQNDTESATSDILKAIKLDPRNAESERVLGWLMFMHGDDNSAILNLQDALSLRKSYPGAAYDMACVEVTRGHAEVALRYLQATVSMSPHGEMVEDARLLMWILEARQGRSDLANTELVAYLDDDTQRKRDWAKNIGAYLVGRKSEDDLLGTANSTNSYLDRLQHTRVWYFIGMKRQIVGDSAGAGDAFHKCIDYGVTHEEYFVFAKGLIGSSPAGFHNASPYNFGGAMVILVLLAFGSLGFFCIVLAGVVVWLSLNRNSRLTVAGQPPPVSPGLPPVPPSARPTPRPVIPPPPPPQ